MSSRDKSAFTMPEPADEERRFTPAEIDTCKRARWDEWRKTASFLLIGLAFSPGLMFPYMGWPLFVVIVAFLIWPSEKRNTVQIRLTNDYPLAPDA